MKRVSESVEEKKRENFQDSDTASQWTKVIKRVLDTKKKVFEPEREHDAVGEHLSRILNNHPAFNGASEDMVVINSYSPIFSSENLKWCFQTISAFRLNLQTFNKLQSKNKVFFVKVYHSKILPFSVSDHSPPGMTPPGSTTKTNIITDTTIVAELNENTNNNNNATLRSKYREMGDIFETKTSFGGFESANTSDYEEEDTIPETIMEEPSGVSENDKNLEVCIIPDDCQVIKVGGGFGAGRIVGFKESFSFSGGFRDGFEDRIGGSIAVGNVGVGNNDFQLKRRLISASDSRINNVQVSSDVVSSIKSEINTKLNDDEIQKIIRIYQENQLLEQIKNEESESNQSHTTVLQKYYHTPENTLVRSAVQSSQYITPLPDDNSRKNSNETDEWGTPAVTLSSSGSPEWKNK